MADQAEQLSENGDCRQALDVYTGLVKGCDTRDGIEAIQTGIARAHNETGNYNDAYNDFAVELEISPKRDADQARGLLLQLRILLHGCGTLAVHDLRKVQDDARADGFHALG